MTIFEKYNLEIKEINGSIAIVTNNHELRILSHFLDYWNKPKEIIDDLLPELDPVLKGEMSFNDIGADVIGIAFIEKNKTQLTNSELGFADLELPTLDFKELIMEWLEFLEKEGK